MVMTIDVVWLSVIEPVTSRATISPDVTVS